MNNSVEFIRQQDRFQTTFTYDASYSLNQSINQQADSDKSQSQQVKNFQEVFADWMTEHEKLLRHIITGFEAKPAIQDELFQEIALNVWRALPTFRFDSAVKTFIARIAHNVLATHVAKSVRTVKADKDLAAVPSEAEQDLTQPTPFQSLDQKQRQQRLAHAIRQLKLDQQQVITLALEGMSYQEIAEVLSITTNLVGVRLQRAKKALTQLLESK
ncbi:MULTISPECIES: sigma-70 family RNA polymerase sigma factor [Thalassotalea]|uniref:Sigma-70 family RNA polymerase sigma factor n=1 Tax=Thalassotalea castellviae TaxID=3075612 RepID=A0ABU2ZYP7_9GAMM|nr:sigma-70 family RNA polymerase sigma factor [Thalassotalea sp. W431]MDT0603039.1 sigma-70 family RNA polymerase sigma factor [Thalassotalea sp. W431]